MLTSLSNEALTALQSKLDHVANANALMYDDLDTIEQAKNVLELLNGISERYRAALEYIYMHRDDFEDEGAMTGHEQVIFRTVAAVLGHT